MKASHRFLLASIIFLTISFTLRSQDGLPAISYLDRAGNDKTPGHLVADGNREMPPGLLLYSQPFSCPPWNGIMSTANYYPVESADDFILTDDTPVNFVRWWFFMEEDPTIPWIINIYNEASCLPSSLVGSWNILVGSEYHQMVCTNGVYHILEHRAALEPAFIPVPGQHYWISIRAVNNYYDYWCCYGEINDYFNCPGAFRGTTIGPDFIPMNQYFGWDTDFTFELYNVENPDILDVPISNWAIGLGVIFIIAAAFFRYKRML